ncbi:Transcriptional regulator, TetR family [Sphingomonas paucimobilis]|nr:Transcriptional regulator, TetR family [Sphingomonas paucimobilis]
MVARAGLIRVGGRTERNRDAVVNAARKLLECGETDLNVARLSALSGVHKTTIYRRWPSREILLQEILRDRRRELVIEPSDDWRQYLENLARGLTEFLSSPSEFALMTTLIHADPSYAAEVRAIWLPLAESLAEPLVSAQGRGEISDHVEAVEIVRIIIGFIISEALISRETPTMKMLANAVQYLADGIRSRG